MESLPAELIFSLASYLLVEDLRNLRLSAPLIALATRPLLALHEFKGLAWRDEARRLHSLAAFPLCARRIRVVDINLGRLDAYTALHQTFLRLWHLDPEVRTERGLEERARFEEVQALFDRVGPVAYELFEKALPKLPNLESLAMSWTRNPWAEGVGSSHYFNAEASVRYSVPNAVSSQRAMLTALCKMEVLLQSLTMEGLLLDHLNVEELLSTANNSKALRSVEHLSLVVFLLDRKSYRAERLERLIGAMPNLRRLRVELMAASGTPEVNEFLPCVKLPLLEDFELSCKDYELDVFAGFLLRHRHGLQRLRLQSRSREPWEASWDVITGAFEGLEWAAQIEWVSPTSVAH